MNTLRTPCLLVTGGAGFIGSHFVHTVIQKGLKVIVLDALTYAGHRQNLAPILPTNSLELVVGNICDRDLVSQLLQDNQVSSVVNFAAESHVDRSISGPQAFIDTNIQGTFQLLNASLSYWERLEGPLKEKFRFLQVSTDEVYGSLGPVGKFNETTPYAPNSPYSASKASADLLVRAWHHTYGLPTLTTNCSNNYGPRQYPEKLIPTLITRALEGKPLPIYGDGGNIRDWIHVQDHCNGVTRALEFGKPGATYCFGGNEERNNLGIAQLICQELDQVCPRKDGKLHSTSIEFVTDRLGHDRRYAIDDSLAQKELGFKRDFTLEEGLSQTVRWYLDHKDWLTTVREKKA